MLDSLHGKDLALSRCSLMQLFLSVVVLGLCGSLADAGRAIGSNYDNRSPGSAFESASGNIILASSGYDVGGREDECMFFPLQSDKPDFDLTVRFEQFRPADNGSKAGIMIRESLDPSARNYFFLLNGLNELRIQHRLRKGGDTEVFGKESANVGQSVPLWMHVAKDANRFTALFSTDGTTWIQFDVPKLVPMSVGSMLVGLAVTSHSEGGALTQATFVNVPQTAVPSTDTFNFSPLPAGRYVDLGELAVPGTAEYDAAAETYRISAAGRGLWGTEEQIGFLPTTTSGDFSITARVTSVSVVDQWTMAGLMIRQSLDPASPMAAAALVPQVERRIQVRDSQGVDARQFGGSGIPADVAMMRMTKNGVRLTWEWSDNGVEWAVWHTEEMDWLASSGIVAGIFTASNLPSELATAIIDRFDVTTLAANSFIVRNGLPTTPVETINFGGFHQYDGQRGRSDGQAFRTSDGKLHIATTASHPHGEMEMAPIDLPGTDFQITVFLERFVTEGDNASCGIMIRESADVSAANVMLYVGSGQGVLIRTSDGGDSNHRYHGWGFRAGHEAIPLWMRLEKKGNQYTGYTSIDGQVWNRFDNPVTFDMNTSNNIVGGVVAAANYFAIDASEATFSNVKVIAV